MITPTLLFDVDAALWTRLCAHVFDCLLRLFVFAFFGFVAVAVLVPGTVAGQTEFVGAVRAGRLVGAVLGCGRFRVRTAAGFSGEVDAALWVEAGDVGWRGGEEVLGDCCVPSDVVSGRLYVTESRTYVSKRAFVMIFFSVAWSRTASHSGNMQGKCASARRRSAMLVLICFWMHKLQMFSKCSHVASSAVLKERFVSLVVAQMMHSVF